LFALIKQELIDFILSLSQTRMHRSQNTVFLHRVQAKFEWNCSCGLPQNGRNVNVDLIIFTCKGGGDGRRQRFCAGRRMEGRGIMLWHDEPRVAPGERPWAKGCKPVGLGKARTAGESGKDHVWAARQLAAYAHLVVAAGILPAPEPGVPPGGKAATCQGRFNYRRVRLKPGGDQAARCRLLRQAGRPPLQKRHSAPADEIETHKCG
jgi:hypothetical protein